MTSRKSTLTQATRKHAPPRKKRLTELSVRKAKAGAAATVTWDILQRGLALRVQPTGRKSWYVVYSRHGRPRWLHLGAADAIGLADARTLAAEAMLAVARGGDPAAERKAQRGSGTFAELADRYLEHAKKVNKSWAQARALVQRHLLPKWGKLQTTAITRSDIKAMMARIEAPVTANQTLAAASAILTWAVKEELAAANPCKLIDRNPTKSRERVLADLEVPLFWKAFGEADLVTGAALKTILLTGQRPGEVARMRREHITDGGWWTMPGMPDEKLGWRGTKNKKTHRVWLPASVQSLIGEGSAGFVFAGPRGHAVGGLDATMREISAKLGVDPVWPHDLRRTHGTTITKLKFGRDAMNRVQNHKEGGIADVYDVHDYAEENERIMEATAARLLFLAGVALPDNVLRIA